MNEVITSRAGFIRANARGRKKPPVISAENRGAVREILITSKDPISEVFFPDLKGKLEGPGLLKVANGYKWTSPENTRPVLDDLDEPNTDIFQISEEIELSGNIWEKRKFRYNVTAFTVLELEFKSNSEPESSMIVFDRENLKNITTPCIQFLGPDAISGISSNIYKVYDKPGEWIKFKIRLGNYFTGKFSRLAFVNDVCSKQGDSNFRNILVYELEPVNRLSFSYIPESGESKDIISSIQVKTVVKGKVRTCDPQSIKFYDSANELTALEEIEDSTPELQTIQEVIIEKDVTNPAESEVSSLNEENVPENSLEASSVVDMEIPGETIAESELPEEEKLVQEEEKIEVVIEDPGAERPVIPLIAEGTLPFDDSVEIAELEIVVNGEIDVEKFANLNLFSMLNFTQDFAGSKQVNWSFISSSDSFYYLTENDSIVLFYKVKPAGDEDPEKVEDLVISILGSENQPYILNSFTKLSSVDSILELPLMKQGLSNEPEDKLHVKGFNLAVSGPINEEFNYELDEDGLFKLDPAQFSYLNIGEQLTIVGSYNLENNSGDCLQEGFTILVLGQSEDISALTTVVQFDEPPVKPIKSEENIFSESYSKAESLEYADLSFQASDEAQEEVVYTEDDLSFDTSYESMHDLEEEKKQKDFRIITQYNLDEKINLGESLVGEFDCFDNTENPEK